MPPKIHLIRHAQGFHNLSTAAHALHDPILTDLGKEQCAQLARDFPYTADITAVVASPMKRTIYTALETFNQAPRQTKMEVIALPELQETSDLPCDTGSPIAELKREFQGQPVDFHLVEAVGESWYEKRGPWEPTAHMVDARAFKARIWLKELLSKTSGDVAVVTHGGFVHYLTEDWEEADKFSGTGWANTEFRSYTFDPSRSEHASLIETPESRQRRAGLEHPLSEAEQRNLKDVAHNSWVAQGLLKEIIASTL